MHICVREPLYLAFSISLKSLKHYMFMFSCTVRICVVVHLCISVWRLINSQDRNTQGLPDYTFYNWGLHALCMQKPQLGTNDDASMSVAVEAEINCSTDQQSSLSFYNSGLVCHIYSTDWLAQLKKNQNKKIISRERRKNNVYVQLKVYNPKLNQTNK